MSTQKISSKEKVSLFKDIWTWNFYSVNQIFMTLFEKSKKFLRPLLESPKYLTLSVIKFIFWAFYAIAAVILIKETTWAIEEKDINLFTKNIFYFCIFITVYFVGNFLWRKWEWPILYYITEKYITERCIRKLIMLDNNYIEAIWTGKVISIVNTGIRRWNELLTFLLRDFSRAIIVFMATIYILYSMNQAYGILFLVIVWIIHILVAWIDGFARKYRSTRTRKRHESTRKIVQIIMSKTEILQNNQIDTRVNELKSIYREIEDADDKVSQSLFFIFNIPRLFLAVARIGILYFIGYGVFSGNFSITDFTLAMTVLIMFETFLLDSVEFYKNFTKDFSDIQSLWDTIDWWPNLVGYSTGKSFTPNTENIILKNISYKYGESPVFRDFSLTIEKWKKTAFVGASGGGKTTLIKLIAGYLHPEKWSISVMGNILSETALKTYYPHIGYLTQDPSVFDATIRENLLSALPENTDTSINEKLLIEALRHAKCEFVFEMKDGLDTEIGERWVRLSGWQKQRLAIAKIFLKNPEIILLDEPTSALDSFSEEQITEALDTLFEGRTVIIVAHRLQTVKKADDIIVIEKWEVAERGTHASLTKAKWIYQKMLELQSGF